MGGVFWGGRASFDSVGLSAGVACCVDGCHVLPSPPKVSSVVVVRSRWILTRVTFRSCCPYGTRQVHGTLENLGHIFLRLQRSGSLSGMDAPSSDMSSRRSTFSACRSGSGRGSRMILLGPSKSSDNEGGDGDTPVERGKSRRKHSFRFSRGPSYFDEGPWGDPGIGGGSTMSLGDPFARRGRRLERNASKLSGSSWKGDEIAPQRAQSVRYEGMGSTEEGSLGAVDKNSHAMTYVPTHSTPSIRGDGSMNESACNHGDPKSLGREGGPSIEPAPASDERSVPDAGTPIGSVYPGRARVIASGGASEAFSNDPVRYADAIQRFSDPRPTSGRSLMVPNAKSCSMGALGMSMADSEAAICPRNAPGAQTCDFRPEGHKGGGYGVTGVGADQARDSHGTGGGFPSGDRGAMLSEVGASEDQDNKTFDPILEGDWPEISPSPAPANRKTPLLNGDYKSPLRRDAGTGGSGMSTWSTNSPSPVLTNEGVTALATDED